MIRPRAFIPTSQTRHRLVYAIKGSRFITHIKRLSDLNGALDKFFERIKPVEKRIGDTLLSGTLNLWGAVEVSALRPAAQSALHKIIELIKEAQLQKAPSQRFTDKFSTYYTYSVLGLSVAK